MTAGLLREGYAADIVIFNENEVKDISTFEKPHAYSKGFHYVIVNGVLTVENEKHNGSRAGKALYGPAYSNQKKTILINGLTRILFYFFRLIHINGQWPVACNQKINQ